MSSYVQIYSAQELQPFDKSDHMYVMPYKNKQKQFGKHKHIVILKDAELFIFEKLSAPPKYQFPLDHCQAVAVSEDVIKLSAEVQYAGPLFKLTAKDQAEFLMLPDSFEKQFEWVQTLLNYSENYKIYLKHKINANTADEKPCVRVMILLPNEAEQLKLVAQQILMNLARVQHVTIDEEGVVDVYGQVISPIGVLDALECAGFQPQLLSLYNGM
ncbi:Pleckstrin_homology domain-containing protein [Hexamita inflata]|uniref:Pleckstrin homology domain-containing protein n=1 Tax=Hexamita inflata TaxID=28002 RepID=A0AA86NRS3_9EUKA|nr:Pleckstrin homology domain-containing protein [Hexamita inflata]